MPADTQPPSSGNTNPPLDILAVYRRCLNDAGFVQMTAECFRGKVGATADELSLALASKNLKETHRLAHSLRGVAAHMSAATLCEICFRIEYAAKNEDYTTAVQAAAPLHAEIARCIDYLPTALAELSKAA